MTRSSPAACPRVFPALAAMLVLGACVDRNPVASPPSAGALDAGASTPSVTAASSPWHIELGTMGGTESRAAGLNEAGQVVGAVTLASGSTRGFVWTPSSPGGATGTMVALQPPAGSGATEALAINESGTVVGFYGYSNRAALWMPADSGYTAVDLGGLSARWPRSVASAINDAGQVAGMSHQEIDYRRAVLWTPASPGSTTFTMRILGDLGGNDGVANGINNAGYVAGAARLAGYGRAFLWKPGAVRVIAISSVKTRDSHGAWGINDGGEVVGGGADLNAGGTLDPSYAWVWTPSAPGATTGTRRRLAPEASSAHHSEGLAINAHGQVAGVQRYYVYPAFVEEPVVWMGGVRRVLHLPPGHQGVATAIADDGRVAGRMKGPDGKWRAVLWHALAPAPAVTAALAAPASPVSARTYTYDASASVHSDGRPLTFHWDLDGDGTSDRTTGTTPWTTLALPAGTHTVRVVATADGLADTASVTVTVVRNLAPVITLGPAPGPVPEGSAVSYTFTVADADHSRFTYDWTWGDGTTSTGVSTHRYTDNGWYPVRLIVRDPSGRADTAQFRQTITNLPPTARFWAPASVAEGRPFVLQLAHPTDPGTADRASLQYSFGCGDDEGWRPYSPASRITCPQDGARGIHIVYARIRDKDGAVTEYPHRLVRVTNVRPVVEARLADPGAPRGPVAFRFTDGGAADGPWMYRVRRGNGTYTAWLPATPGTWITTPAYPYPSGSHAEAVYVRDQEGAIGYSAPVTLVVP